MKIFDLTGRRRRKKSQFSCCHHTAQWDAFMLNTLKAKKCASVDEINTEDTCLCGDTEEKMLSKKLWMTSTLQGLDFGKTLTVGRWYILVWGNHLTHGGCRISVLLLPKGEMSSDFNQDCDGCGRLSERFESRSSEITLYYTDCIFFFVQNSNIWSRIVT